MKSNKGTVLVARGLHYTGVLLKHSMAIASSRMGPTNETCNPRRDGVQPTATANHEVEQRDWFSSKGLALHRVLRMHSMAIANSKKGPPN